MALLVGNVPWFEEEGQAKRAIAKKLKVSPKHVTTFRMVKRSLDARHKSQVYQAVYRVEVTDEVRSLERQIRDVRRWTARDEGRYGLADGAPTKRSWPQGSHVVIVGAGPAGLFCALYLAEAGAHVTLLERGAPVEERIRTVTKQWRRKEPLDVDSNVVFGEGGAGTFSDGKIYTRRRDGELGFIFRRLVDFGADEAAFSEALAHLGTDRMRAVLPRFRSRLEELKVTVRFHAVVTDLIVEEGVCTGVRLGEEELRASAVVMATGHSARDSVEVMLRAGAAAKPRGIAIGARIEHPQSMINKARYGEAYSQDLPPASYRLTHQSEGGGSAWTFCMCPGGMVVPANNHKEHTVVNGMSFAARGSFWANSALIVGVPAEEYGSDDPMAGFEWQDRIERRAFEIGGDDRAPAQRVVDFMANRPSMDLPKTSYPMGVVPTNLRDLFPPVVVKGMLDALNAFDEQIAGFKGPDAVLIAPETRTTSPIKFLRNEDQESTTVSRLFPSGEGAGYAGGIVSSALDGLRTARALCLRE